MKRGTPAQQHRRDERRQSLLDGARALFARKGYHATTVDDITREAGVAKGTLKDMMDSVEKYFLLEALREHNNNKSNAAKALDISRQQLYMKLRKYGITPRPD